MSEREILSIIKYLPDLVQRKIFLMYAESFLNDSNIKWPRERMYKDYELIGYFFDKIDRSGYIKFQKSYLNLLMLKFPNMSFEFAEPAHIRKFVYLSWDLLKKLKYLFNIRLKSGLPASKPKLCNILVAGGYFTNYITNVFKNEFPDYFDYFHNIKDIDIFYYNRLASRDDYKNSIYLGLKDYQTRFNLVGSRNEETLDIIKTFDWDCCNSFFTF